MKERDYSIFPRLRVIPAVNGYMVEESHSSGVRVFATPEAVAGYISAFYARCVAELADANP